MIKWTLEKYKERLLKRTNNLTLEERVLNLEAIVESMIGFEEKYEN